jgi:hypothetical protein
MYFNIDKHGSTKLSDRQNVVRDNGPSSQVWIIIIILIVAHSGAIAIDTRIMRCRRAAETLPNEVSWFSVSNRRPMEDVGHNSPVYFFSWHFLLGR